MRVWNELSGHREGNNAMVDEACTKCRPPEMNQRLLRSMGLYSTSADKVTKRNENVLRLDEKKRKKKKPKDSAAA